MKTLLRLSLLLLLALFLTQDATAQKRHHKTEEKSDFWRDKVYYGGSIGLGYSSGRYSSRFLIGIAPMMGFKIKKSPFSVGPRIGYTYISLKAPATDGRVHQVGLSSKTIAAFGRVKFLRTFFLHAEYELEWSKRALATGIGTLALDNSGKVLTEKLRRDNIYAGLGYNGGGYELMLLYNFKVPEDSFEQPFSIRGGFVVNF